MELIEDMVIGGHEQVLIYSDRSVGLKAIIAIHDTTLGPACGGTRIWPYESEVEALTDALRLSQAMTYKSAAADLALGGGKAVIILPGFPTSAIFTFPEFAAPVIRRLAGTRTTRHATVRARLYNSLPF